MSIGNMAGGDHYAKLLLEQEEYRRTEALQAELDEAKRHLYHLLLQKPAKDWTDREAQIGFELMKDASIQRRLDGEKA